MRRTLSIILLLFGCSHDINPGYWGSGYLEAKYVSDSLGEASLPDDDPLIRFDAFDCTTFVETVLADGNLEKLTKIRYTNGIPDFINRNHFIETDWIKNNADLVYNATEKYGETKLRTVVIDKQNWMKKNHNIDINTPLQTVELNYIPYMNISDIHPQTPVIILFIANTGKIRDKIGTDLAVRHMGILLPNGVLRHASRKAGRVVDVNFSKYIKQIMENKNNLGIMVLEIKK